MQTDCSSTILHAAATTARVLENAGITVLAHYSNGRRAVLVIDRPPQGVVGAMKRRQSDGRGGLERVMAADYQGMQLEWLQRAPQLQEVANG
jgi:hypothetical protein